MRVTVGPLVALAVAAMMAAPAAAQDHEFVGVNTCRKCHIKEYKSWSETKMSKAFETLKPGVAADRKQELGLDAEKDYTTDENCITCHVTGWGKPGGFTSIDETPALAGITCEACHGAGGSYTQDGLMTLQNKEYKRADLIAAGLTHPIDESVCQQCHNENVPIPDYTFDFATKKAEGTHENFPLKYNHD